MRFVFLDKNILLYKYSFNFFKKTIKFLLNFNSSIYFLKVSIFLI